MSVFKESSVFGFPVPEDAPLYIEPIIGYRLWRVWLDPRTHTPVLRSITFQSVWDPDEPLEAQCWHQVAGWPYLQPPHEAPSAHHKCGIYAWKSDLPDLERNVSSWRGTLDIEGTVKLWGRILCYELGYLAQYAYPLSFTAASGGVTRRELENLISIYHLDTDPDEVKVLDWR